MTTPTRWGTPAATEGAGAGLVDAAGAGLVDAAGAGLVDAAGAGAGLTGGGVGTGREKPGVTDAAAGALGVVAALRRAPALRRGVFLPAAFLRAGFRRVVFLRAVFLRPAFFRRVVFLRAFFLRAVFLRLAFFLPVVFFWAFFLRAGFRARTFRPAGRLRFADRFRAAISPSRGAMRLASGF
ncbi:MAG: hypothetical protein V3T07_04995 [Myxococcota bacterium]